MIAKELRQHMHRQQLTARELARKSGVKSSFIYDILNGKSTNPSTVKLAKVAHVLGLNLSQLVDPSPIASPCLKVATTIAYDTQIFPEWLNTPPSSFIKISPLSFSKRWLCDQLDSDIASLSLFHICGDSMSPTLYSGDVVLISRQHVMPSPAGLYVIHDGTDYCARRLECRYDNGRATVRVSCDNDFYASYESGLDALNVSGRIIWMSRILH